MQHNQKNARKMSSTLIPLSAMVLALSLTGCASNEKKPVKAQPQAAKPVAAQPAPQAKNSVPPPPPIVEQYALDRLKQMSDNIAAAKALTYHATSFAEMPAPTGQFLTLAVVSEVALQRPDKLRVNVYGDVPAFEVYFDGDKVSTFDPKKKVHSVSTKSVATLDEMLDMVTSDPEINFPSADFMYSNPYAVMTKNLTHAIVVGESMVDSVPCEHFAYMEPMINWEIWIEKGKHALPLRLAMTYKQAQNFPRFMVEYKDWNLNPKLKANTFVFNAPAESKQIEFSTHRHEQKSK
jgi:hypothetical protein